MKTASWYLTGKRRWSRGWWGRNRKVPGFGCRGCVTPRPAPDTRHLRRTHSVHDQAHGPFLPPLPEGRLVGAEDGGAGRDRRLQLQIPYESQDALRRWPEAI